MFLSLGLWNANGLQRTAIDDVLQHCTNVHILFITETLLLPPPDFRLRGNNTTTMPYQLLTHAIPVVAIEGDMVLLPSFHPHALSPFSRSPPPHTTFPPFILAPHTLYAATSLPTLAARMILRPTLIS